MHARDRARCTREIAAQFGGDRGTVVLSAVMTTELAHPCPKCFTIQPYFSDAQ